MVDTAGRLQNKAGLMDELGKVKRVIQKQAPVTEGCSSCAAAGQNGPIEARPSSEVGRRHRHRAHQLHGSAKGGIIVAVQRKLGVPVTWSGWGRGPRPGALRTPRVRRRDPRLMSACEKWPPACRATQKVDESAGRR